MESGHAREFGRADIRIARESPLLAGLGDIGAEQPVWMSHGDKITAMPPGFEVVATSDNSPFAVIADEGRRDSTACSSIPRSSTLRAAGAEIYRNFTHRIASPDWKGDWSMAAFKDEAIARIRQQVGKGKVICTGSRRGRPRRWPRC